MINDIDINKTVASNKFPFDKQDFEYFIGCKNKKEIRSLCTLVPEISIIKWFSDKTNCMHFMIKDEKIFDLVYRKDGNYYPKVLLEKFIHNPF